MKLWATEVRAICAVNLDMRNFCGPNIRAWTKEDAHKYCQSNGWGYCIVTDEIVCEIPCFEGTIEPDFSKMIDYEIEESPDNKRIYMDNAFEKWLTEKGIEWHKDEGSINALWVQEKNLLPYETELREKFPEFKFFSNVVREDAEPRSPTGD